jgi:hypothetical protein
MTESEALARAGFSSFVHLDSTKRDGKKRFTWTGVLHEELVTVRVVAEETGWQVDYVNPDAPDIFKRFCAACTVVELVAFITNLRANKGRWPG